MAREVPELKGSSYGESGLGPIKGQAHASA